MAIDPYGFGHGVYNINTDTSFLNNGGQWQNVTLGGLQTINPYPITQYPTPNYERDMWMEMYAKQVEAAKKKAENYIEMERKMARYLLQDLLMARDCIEYGLSAKQAEIDACMSKKQHELLKKQLDYMFKALEKLHGQIIMLRNIGVKDIEETPNATRSGLQESF